MGKRNFNWLREFFEDPDVQLIVLTLVGFLTLVAGFKLIRIALKLICWCSA